MPPVPNKEGYFTAEPLSEEYFQLRDAYGDTHTMVHVVPRKTWDGESEQSGLLVLVPNADASLDEVGTLAESVVANMGIIDDPKWIGLGGWYVTRDEAEVINGNVPPTRLHRLGRAIRLLLST